MATNQTLGSVPLQTPGQVSALTTQVDPQKPQLNKSLSLSSIAQLATQVQAQSKGEVNQQQKDENTPQPDLEKKSVQADN